MAGNDTENKVVLEIGLDHSGVQKGLQTVSRQTKKFWADIGKQSQKYSKAVKEVARPSMYSKMALGVKKVAAEYRRFDREMGNFSAHVNSLYREMGDASGKRLADIKKEIAETQRLQKIHVKAEASKGLMGKARVGMHKAVGAVKNASKDSSGKEIKAAAGGAILGAFAAGSALLKKDFQGMFEEGAKAVGKGWTAAFAASGKSMGMLGRALSKGGAFLQKKGAEKGGMQGAAMGALGGAGKALGGMAKSLGPLLNVVAKLGPLLGGAASIIMKIVTLFMDVESKAKELNKQILQVSGSSGFFYKNIGDGDAALEDMGKTLGKIRSDATSLDNIGWGINKDDHMAMLSTLAAEGVRIEGLQKQFDAVSASADEATAHAKSFGGVVQVAVAYSRQFGVSLTELTQFQGEMMTDLGSNLTDVQLQFHQMGKAANDSGIASNKFFAIIRGVSSDLNLYNSRLEDSVKILGLLGKAMSPRNAGKFMQTITKAFQGKGRTDLLKMNLLGGGKGGSYVKKDLDRKAGGLADKIGGGTTAKDILDSTKDTAELLKNVPKEQQGAYREAIIEMRTDAKMNKKGVFGQSMAMGNLSPGAAAQMTEDALMRFSGGGKNADGSKKKLADVAGEIGPEMMAEQLGISREEMMGRVKMAATLDDQRDILKKSYKTAEGQKKLAKLGIKEDASDADKMKAIDELGYDQLMDTMDEDQQKALKDSAVEIDYAKRTSEYTSTVSDKLEALGDFVMNELYGAMKGILDVLEDILLSPLFGEAVVASVNMMAKSIPTVIGGPLAFIADAVSNLVKVASFGKVDLSDKLGKMMKESMHDIAYSGAKEPGTKAERLAARKKELSGEEAGIPGSPASIASKLAEKTEAAKTAKDGGKPREMTGFSRDEATATPTPGQSPAAAAAAAKSEKIEPITEKQGDDTLSALDSIQSVLFTKGIKINKTFLKDVFWTNGHDSVLEATREALFEYFLYSKMDPGDVAMGLKDGSFTAKTFGAQASSYAKDTGTPAMLSEQLKGHAKGGVIPQPKSPDSIFVAAKPGETILPKGAGQGDQANLTIPISVNGPGGQELANMMRSAAIDVVQQWQRKQKYT